LFYSCAECRARLTTGQTMCRCGQVFPFPVPEFSESYNSMYWPPASASQPAALNWWNDLSPAIKASVGGAVALLAASFAVGGSVHQYQTMHARYAPGRPVVVASAAPVRVQVSTVPVAPSAPPPLVLEAAPRYVPPTRPNTSVPDQPQAQQTAQGGTTDFMKPTPDQVAAEQRYNAASADAMHWSEVLEKRDGPGAELGSVYSHGELGGGFSDTEKFVISDSVSKMRQDLDVMQQNFSAMSPSAQGMADPSTTGIPSAMATEIGSAKENVQNAIDKWQKYGR